MAGIYLHIPFCRKACHYCDFHFSTSLEKREQVLQMMQRELEQRSGFFKGVAVSSVYFGGGTPSLLSGAELGQLMELVRKNYAIQNDAEVTLEANPDDLNPEYLAMLSQSGVNRLSIGVQSFRSEDLAAMNRAHSAEQALSCISDAGDAGFSNISIDLMFGWPGLSMEAWKDNVKQALDLPITHLSCYGLTVEERTALTRKIAAGEIETPDDALAAEQYLWLLESAETSGIPWYEISNFCREGFASRHNTSYWTSEPYLGIGPSAHSFNGVERSWNVSSNSAYVQGWERGFRAAETETASEPERINEYILTGLRMRRGLDLSTLKSAFGPIVHDGVLKRAGEYIDSGALLHHQSRLAFTTRGLLFADRITAELFSDPV
ncbi:MAG: radical SAM family heme chaperone HemW [Sphingobacteriales bacterium]|jgi:oxygen-independent coproporphyrinogen-3 oxidase|nr:radical SAM family heme chaperone HemW [Sphingobacteriales bacterium]